MKENGLPSKFILLISTQIKRQIFDYLDQMLNNLTELYEAKLNDKVINEINPRKISERIIIINSLLLTNHIYILDIKNKILYSLNETLETCQTDNKISDKFFLQNVEMVSLLNKNSDIINQKSKSLFEKQRNLYQKSMIQHSPYLLPTDEKKFINNLSQPTMMHNTFIPNKELNPISNQLLCPINTTVNGQSLFISDKVMMNSNQLMNNATNSNPTLNFKPQYSNIPNMNQISGLQNISSAPAINFNQMNGFRGPNWQVRPVNMAMNNRYWGVMQPFPNMKNFMPVNSLPQNANMSNSLTNSQNQIYGQNKVYPTNILSNGMNNTRK